VCTAGLRLSARLEKALHLRFELGDLAAQLLNLFLGCGCGS
jgi:hypothetical protein